ncbi:acetoacetate--CoA ligase [Dactylosporangium sp. CA-092794]|uniref:acetoacetate--CoA ligase n=1 Tax=Dactylosporangium sp. CA-092794 TaxID=3239929 RepID=UPI003D8D2B11
MTTLQPAQLWAPSDGVTSRAAITSFARLAADRGGPPPGAPYDDLWQWSVRDLPGFWGSVAEFCGVAWETPPDRIVDDAAMPDTKWFPGGRLNYASQVFRTPRSGVAIVGHDETETSRTLTWDELEAHVAALAATLTALGVRAGDRVVGYLPDIPEAIVAFLATASLGAIWAGCGTDLAAEAARARFCQMGPSVLVAAAGHHHRGRWVDRTHEVAQLREGLPSLRASVLIGNGHRDGPGRHDETIAWAEAAAPSADAALSPLPLPADHPLWVLFTSGTTGPPKGIVHGHAGVVVEHLKTLSLHLDIGAGDQFFWYTTLNWMMWNLRAAGLLQGATVHCFDGAPTPANLWGLAERAGITHLGISPGFLNATRDAGVHPAADFDLSALRSVGCTGSVLTAPVHEWAAAELGPGVLIGSTSGGTDVVSGFAGSVPTEPIRAGEIAVRCLGADLHAWSATGEPLLDEVGELVVTSPMPSMPLRFWNDPDGSRYRTAYFEEFPGVWRHGDWVTLTSRGSVILHGRSDATLNRAGIRMGSADICQAAEDLPEVSEALVVGLEEPDGGYWMPMFVTLAEGITLDAALASAIKAAVRNRVSPRHVPDEVIQAPGIPHTHTGKKLEVPVKTILRGIITAAQAHAVDRPELLDFYRHIGEARRERS